MFEYHAYVTSVYDGDTIRVDIDLGFGLHMQDVRLRLAGIDAPEIRGESRIDGLVTRDRLRSLILDRWVTVETIRDSQGKYGRYLAHVHVDGKCVNNILLDEGLADVYPRD